MSSGDYSIELEDGTTLHATSILGLAWKWAEANNAERWGALTYQERCAEATTALLSLKAPLADESGH